MAAENRIPDNPVTTDWASLNTAQRIKHLEIEGYVLIPDLLPQDRITAITKDLDRLQRGESTSGHGGGGPGDQSQPLGCLNRSVLSGLVSPSGMVKPLGLEPSVGLSFSFDPLGMDLRSASSRCSPRRPCRL